MQKGTGFPNPALAMARNLLKNPNGDEQMKYWELTKNRGNQWRVEDLPGDCGHDFVDDRVTKYFSTSFGLCLKRQVVDLQAEGYSPDDLDASPAVYVKDWYCGRTDCGCIYHLTVCLLDENQKVLKEFKPDPVTLDSRDCSWRQVNLTFSDYGPGLRFISFEHGGHDTKCWAGWYGVRVTGSSVTIQACKERGTKTFNTMLFQEQTDEDFLRKVVPHLKNGLFHLRDSSELLLTLDSVQTVTLKEKIQKAVDSLSESEVVANSYLEEVNKHTEDLTRQKGRLESESQRLKTNLDKLKTEHQAIDDNLKNHTEALKTAEREMESSQSYLDECRETERKKSAERDLGIGLSFIPVVGLFIGLPLLVAAEHDRGQAEERAERAGRERDRFHSLVKSNKEKLYEINEQKRSQQKKDSNCKERIQQTNNRLTEVKRCRTKIADFQKRLRDAVHFLGLLKGRAEVAQEASSKKTILEKPLLNAMTAIVDLLCQAAGHEQKHYLIKEPDIQIAIERLEKTTLRVSAITGKKSDNQQLSDQFY